MSIETLAAPPLMSRTRLTDMLLANPATRAGSALLACYLIVWAISLFWTPYPPQKLGAGPAYSAPSSAHWMGTDRLGSDMFSRVMAATQVDLLIIFGAVAIAVLVGTVLGTIAGFFGRAADTAVMRVLEVFEAFPTLLLAMLVVQAAGPSLVNMILVMAFVGAPPYLRLTRAEVLARRSLPYVDAARLSGARRMRVAFRHVMPNSLTSVVAYVAVNAAWVALLTASLGFLGLGLPPGTAEWGNMVARGQSSIMTGEWWISFFPGLAIVGLSGALYLLGDGLSAVLSRRSFA